MKFFKILVSSITREFIRVSILKKFQIKTPLNEFLMDSMKIYSKSRNSIKFIIF